MFKKLALHIRGISLDGGGSQKDDAECKSGLHGVRGAVGADMMSPWKEVPFICPASRSICDAHWGILVRENVISCNE
jgi:hypothetical protein